MEKIVFFITFLFVCFLNYNISSKATFLVSGEENKKKILYGHFWFLKYKQYTGEVKRLCFYGFVLEVLQWLLLLWVFPVYILKI